MKKWFSMRKWLVLPLMLAASCVLFAACDDGEPSADVHTHEFSSSWDYDATYHWHNAVCEHTDVVKDHMMHTFVDGKCSECGADAPADAPADTPADTHTHEFSSTWDYDATYHWHSAVCEHTDVVKDHVMHTFVDGKCSECGADAPAETPADTHTHEFSSTWDYDATYHWHNAVCEHTDVVKDHVEHTFVDGKCSECGADAPAAAALICIDMGAGASLPDGEPQVSNVTANVGQKVSQLLPDSPTAKTGFTFKGWYIGNEPVDAQTVPQGGLTVTAKYTVGYTVNVYKEALDGSYGEPETVEGQGTYGEGFEYALSEEHFSLDGTKENRLFTDALDLGDEFTVYLQRNSYPVVYHDFITEDVEDTVSDSDVLYGGSYTVRENMFGPYDGFRFAGWSTEAFGEVDTAYAVGEELSVSGPIDLYAVWDVAYIDRARGFDYIYVLQAESGKVVLDRGGYEFEGTIDESGVFTVEYETVTLTGKVDEATESFMYADVLEEGTYISYNNYYSETLAENAEERFNEEETLVLNRYGEGTIETSYGTFEGVCVALESGEWALVTDDDNFYFILHEVGERKCFMTSGLEYGEYGEFVSTFGFLDGYEGDGLLLLDGYGDATWYDTYHREYYYGSYNFDAERSAASADYSLLILCIDLHIYATDAWLFGDSRYGTYEDRTVYCIIMDNGVDDPVMLYVYEDTHALGTFTNMDDTLVLDGFGQFNDSAVLTEAGEEMKGSFFSYQSEIFGTVVEFTPERGETRYFRLSDDTYEELDGKVTEYVNLHVDEFANHCEFEDPYLVMYEKNAQGDIPTEVYMDVNGEYVLVATGVCTAEEKGDYTLYTLTVTNKVDEGNCPFTSIVFLANDMYTKNEVLVRAYYIFETDGVKGYTTYTGEDETIWSAQFGYDGLGGYYLAADGTVYEGSFSILDGEDYWFESDKQYGVFTYAGEDGRGAYFYFELSGEENLTISKIDRLPDRLTSTDEFYNYWYENFCIGANGAAQFQPQDENENPLGAVNGTYAPVGKTACGDDIYRFTPETNELGVTEFDFIIEYGYVYNEYGMTYIVNVYHEKVTDPDADFVFEVDDGSTLTGDGFWFKGKYEGILGELEGLLYNATDVDDLPVLVFETEEYAIVFDILPDGTLTMRDGLDGYYELLDENSENPNDWMLHLDGYGNVTVEDGNGVVYTGIYEMNDDYVTEIMLTAGNTMLLHFDVVLYTGSSNVAILIDYDNMGMYVAPDLTMLYLDGMNVESFYIDEFGSVYSGDYFLFEEFGVFNFEGGTKVLTFTYDPETLTFEKVDQSAYFGVYYAKDMRGYYILDTIATTKDEKAGYYFVEEGTDGYNVTMYLMGERDNSFTRSTATLKEGVLTVGYSSQYYQLPEGEITLTGTATFGGETKIEGLTLTFTVEDPTSSITATLKYGAVEVEVEISGWNYLFMYYNDPEGFEQSPEIDFDLSSNSFVIVCEYDTDLTKLQQVLGIETP